MTFIEVMLVSALIFWSWARVCEVWLNVIEKASVIERRRKKGKE